MRICIFSGSRSEYGLLKKIILDLQNDSFFKTDFLVSGSHLEKNFGYSIDQIYKDNIWVKRPGTGEILADEYEDLIGKKANQDISSDQQISREHFD